MDMKALLLKPMGIFLISDSIRAEDDMREVAKEMGISQDETCLFNARRGKLQIPSYICVIVGAHELAVKDSQCIEVDKL